MSPYMGIDYHCAWLELEKQHLKELASWDKDVEK